MNDLDVALSASPSSTVAQAKREQVKLKIEVTEQHKARAAQVRARARWLEKGEKNAKYFIVQELCESRGGRPGLSVLTSLLVSVDVKLY